MIKNTIVLVPFPFDDFSTVKVRPALCLTNEIGKYSHIIIAFISSKIPDILTDSDYLIEYVSDEGIGTGLKVDSVIRLHKIVTIPKNLINRKLGSLNETNAKIVKNKLKKLFEIED